MRLGVVGDIFNIGVESNEFVVALAGNPNTGKCVFNALTGLKQHTGNWPGKTVSRARGRFKHNGKDFLLVDLPGTYSLLANSAEEEVARDFICIGKPDITVVVVDATCLERNLNLVMQILEITKKVIICVNLLDEAKRKKIDIDKKRLSQILRVPVVGTNARDGDGLDELKNTIYNMIIEMEEKKQTKINCINGYNKATVSKHFSSRKCINDDEVKDKTVSQIVKIAEDIANEVVFFGDKDYYRIDRKIDNILTSKRFGIPIMLGILGIIFWITIKGANFPSELIAKGLFRFEEHLVNLFHYLGTPLWLLDMLVFGVYRTLAWVVSVMLPPMAIFFPLFTLLEDLGYLPRVAFNLDDFFEKAGAHGKQALTMCMGFGCNAAGVISCRIIDSPRERLIAIITNNFVPCNGRFPILIALSSIFLVGNFKIFHSVFAALSVLSAIFIGVIMTLITSLALSKTILRGFPSAFTLELPPYRRPQIGKVVVRSIFDRTLFVLGRAMIVAAPAGLLIWFMANITIGNMNLLDYCAHFLNPLGILIGLDGYILMAFILGFPANEIVIPIIVMCYMSTGKMLEFDSLSALRELLVANGWTWLTAVCTMLFSLNHFPCGTTLLTILKESGSKKWTLISFLLPTLVGFIVCFLVAQFVRILGLG